MKLTTFLWWNHFSRHNLILFCAWPYCCQHSCLHKTPPPGLGSISRDGGKAFRNLGAMHSDIHDIVFSINDSDRMFCGTNGGVYRSWNGGTTMEIVENLPVSQFYHVSVDNQEPYNIYGKMITCFFIAPKKLQKGKTSKACWLTVAKSRQTRLISVWVLAASSPAKGYSFAFVTRQTWVSLRLSWLIFFSVAGAMNLFVSSSIQDSSIES